MQLSGYNFRTEFSEGVSGRLEANVLLLDDDAGDPIIVATVDTLYGGHLRRLLAHRLDVPDGRIIVLGSHTHFAPGVDSELPLLGPTSMTYVEWVADKIASAIGSHEGFKLVKLSYGQARVEGLFVNRRRPTFGVGIPVGASGRVVMAPHPRGPVNEVARTVTLSVDGRAVAAIWGVACHPVCSPDPLQISACFVGSVRDHIRKSWDAPDLPVLFVQGFSGDIRPASTSRRAPRRLRAMARYLLNGAWSFVPQSIKDYDAWCAALGATVLEAFDHARLDGPQAAEFGISRVTRHPPGWERAIEGTRVDLTADICLVAVNAEVVAERETSLKGFAPTVLPAGCADEVIGYWPTDRMLREGGYEGCDSRTFFPALDWARAGGPDSCWEELVEAVRR